MAAPQNPKNKTQKPNPAATPKQPQPALTSTNTYLPDWTTDWKIYLILILFATGLYLNTVPNKYAFDDSISVTENTFTKEGISGIGKILSTDYLMGMWGREMKMYAGGRYRPLSLVSLAIEYEFFGENPHVSHLVNALLYGLTAFLLFLVLSKLFVRHPWGIGKDNPWYLGLPFIITLLFIAHPLHTEV
ncbi:MAG: hypothetical protein RIS47_2127, partial [Bacteroidota bacterium]